MTPQPPEQPPELWNELHRTLHEPGPTIVITKGQAAYLLERIARAEAAAPHDHASNEGYHAGIANCKEHDPAHDPAPGGPDDYP